MAVENITLNLIPTGDIPSIHVAQFDVDRSFNVTLKEGEDDFTPAGYTIELQVRKVDNNIVTAEPSQASGNVVTFNTTEQMTACSGTNLAELQLTKDDQTFATLYFYLVVQRDVLAGGVSSESDIHDLEQQVKSMLPEVLDDTYYTKIQTDELLDDKANVTDLGIWLDGILLSGSTSLTLLSDDITIDSIIDVYSDVFGVSPTNIVVTTGQIVLTFDAQNSDLNIKVRVL